MLIVMSLFPAGTLEVRSTLQVVPFSQVAIGHRIGRGQFRVSFIFKLKLLTPKSPQFCFDINRGKEISSFPVYFKFHSFQLYLVYGRDVQGGAFFQQGRERTKFHGAE